MRRPSRPFTVITAAALTAVAVVIARPTITNLAELGRNLLVFAVIISVVIGIHELCHLVTARSLGVGVKEYSLGFGPRLLGTRRFGIDWNLRILPLGGFIKVKGESPTADDAAASDSLTVAPVWKKVLIFLAGPASNIVFAWVLLFAAGSYHFLTSGKDFLQAVAGGWAVSWQFLGMIVEGTVNAMASFIPQAIASPLDMPVSGLPGMIGLSGAFVDAGYMNVALLVAGLSLSVGILNFLPIFPFDGGQAFMAVLKSACRGHLPKRIESGLSYAGLGFVIFLMVTINGIDLFRSLIGYVPNIVVGT